MNGGRHVAILGAGPIGLEAALAAREAGLSFAVYERGDEVAANVRDWGHVQLFTPWSMNVSPRMRAALAADGAPPPDGEDFPTGHELVDRVLRPASELPGVREHIRLRSRIVEVSREGVLKSDAIGSPRRGERPFRMLVRAPDGTERVEHADVVLDCTGTYDNPNALGSGGIAAPGEGSMEEHIIRRIPDFEAPDFTGDAAGWVGTRILLVGAGHSAQTAARDLEGLVRRAPETSVVWAIRSSDPGFGAIEDDPLPARDALTLHSRRLASEDSPFDVRLGRSVEALRASPAGIVVTLADSDGHAEEVIVDRIVSLTGSVGDARLYRQLQVHECWATSGPMKLAAALLASSSSDCLAQESHGVDTLRNPEPDFFILGGKSYGRNTTFLLRVGWDQVDEVFSLLAPPAVGVEAR